MGAGRAPRSLLEAEVKVRLSPEDLGALRARLAEIGAETSEVAQQIDLYFAHPCRDFAHTDEALRLRQDPRGLRITYKGAKLDPPRKTREEIEFPLHTDMGIARLLLERLGFRGVGTVGKRRREYRVPAEPPIAVCIDEVQGLGTFCEIEVAAETAGDGRRALAAAMARLGLESLPPIPESYLELLLRRG
jgi:adenylate cyclase class 2